MLLHYELIIDVEASTLRDFKAQDIQFQRLRSRLENIIKGVQVSEGEGSGVIISLHQLRSDNPTEPRGASARRDPDLTPSDEEEKPSPSISQNKDK